MIHVYSTKNIEYTVCFDTMRVFKTHKINRITESDSIQFQNCQFRGNVPQEVLFYLLPLYEKFLFDYDKRQEGKRLVQMMNYDLNDYAARNFNSFTGGKGE